jgi:hypothetical protein
VERWKKMHKKFEEFVLEKSGIGSIKQVYDCHCPCEYKLEQLWRSRNCDAVDCTVCWNYAKGQWLKGQPMETTNEAPTEDGFYFAREKSRKTGKWGEWHIIQCEGKEIYTAGWDIPDYWWAERWERSVDRIKMPGENK